MVRGHGAGRWRGAVAVVSVGVLGAWGCAHRPAQVPTSAPPMVRAPLGLTTRFADDLDRDSLVAAVRESLAYYRRQPAEQRVRWAGRDVSVEAMAGALEGFVDLVETAPVRADLGSLVRTHFEAYRTASPGPEGSVQISGYSAPIVRASLTQIEGYQVPLYGRPPDLVEVWLERFDPRWAGERVTGRLVEGDVVPYHTHEQIARGGTLRGRGLEVAWVRDRVDQYVLHTEGAGVLELPGGERRVLRAAGSNGHPFRSVPEALVQRGYVVPGPMSPTHVAVFLRSRPGEQGEFLAWNPRYIFFELAEAGDVAVHGYPGLSLTAGRSVAADPRIFPRGALGWVEVGGPEPLQRVVLIQDEGAAIQGPGRLDLFLGVGSEAQETADDLLADGTFTLLLPRGTAGAGAPPSSTAHR